MNAMGIAEGRRRAILQEWKRNPTVLVITDCLESLPLRVYFAIPDPSIVLAPALGTRTQDMQILSRPGPPDLNASVWVKASRSHDYRKSYMRFLSDVYGVDAHPNCLPGYDIDHLLNLSRAPSTDCFIRIEAVQSEVNRAWGRLFEKASDFDNRRGIRSMDWMICAKLGNQMPPTGPKDEKGIERLANFFQTIGIGKAEAVKGLEEKLKFAYRPR